MITKNSKRRIVLSTIKSLIILQNPAILMIWYWLWVTDMGLSDTRNNNSQSLKVGNNLFCQFSNPQKINKNSTTALTTNIHSIQFESNPRVGAKDDKVISVKCVQIATTNLYVKHTYNILTFSSYVTNNMITSNLPITMEWLWHTTIDETQFHRRPSLITSEYDARIALRHSSAMTVATVTCRNNSSMVDFINTPTDLWSTSSTLQLIYGRPHRWSMVDRCIHEYSATAKLHLVVTERATMHTRAAAAKLSTAIIHN